MKKIILLFALIFINFTTNIYSQEDKGIDGPKVVTSGETIKYYAYNGLNLPDGKCGFIWTYDKNYFHSVRFDYYEYMQAAYGTFKVQNISTPTATTLIKTTYWYTNPHSSTKHYGPDSYINVTIEKQCYTSTISNRIISTTQNFSDCYINVSNSTISNGAKVNIVAEKEVLITPTFSAQRGSDVNIRIVETRKAATKSIEYENIDYTPQELDFSNNYVTQDIKFIEKLSQNYPNPFTDETLINYNINENFNTAYIQIYNTFGTLVKKIPVTVKGYNTISIESFDLGTGIFIYSLIIDNEIVDTKKMTIFN